jgi:Asp/Glu/hydantoin racemase
VISFLHTSPVHIATFDLLLDEMAPGMARAHRVEEAWLAKAQAGMTPELSATITHAMQQLAASGVGVCTCSTIGAVAEAASTVQAPTFRIDRALMQTAVTHGNRPLIAMCLESTRKPTLDLLADVAADATPIVVMCADAWPHFEAGDLPAYAASIAATIKDKLSTVNADCIVLAQGSMAVAEPLFQDAGLPVLSSPRLGVMRALEMLQQR